MFSDPQPTIEAAQALHAYDLFNPAAIFEVPGRGYVYGRIREMSTPPHETACAVKAVAGYTLVSYCGPLLNVWRKVLRQKGGTHACLLPTAFPSSAYR